MSTDRGGNSWTKYQELVLAELKRLSQEQKATNSKLTAIRIELATLKAKAATWGAVAGFVVTTLVEYLMKKVQ